MGLDMYLTEDIYVGASYEHRQVMLDLELSIMGESIAIDPKQVSEIILQVGYWRKANQIHAWFVENVQNGKDECEKHWVPSEKLSELHELCIAVLNDHTLAEQLLPSQSGFFFGSTEYDEYYYGDLEDTVKILEPLIGPGNENRDFYYQSSW